MKAVAFQLLMLIDGRNNMEKPESAAAQNLLRIAQSMRHWLVCIPWIRDEMWKVGKELEYWRTLLDPF